MNDYVPEERILEACPSCGSGRIACVMHTDLDFCLKCHRVWERLPAREPFTRDGEQQPFRLPCNNCAFRGKSPERLDEERWSDLQFSLSHGGAFYCHKGVPFTAIGEDGKSVVEGERNFEFPRKPDSVVINARNHQYFPYDTERMRLCRGYLNAHVGPLLKRMIADEA